MRKEDLKIVFFGTPEFAVESLDKIVSAGYDVRAVVTMPDKIAGRGHKLLQSDVKRYAVEKGIPVLQPKNLKDPIFISELKAIGANLFIVIAFRMLPESVWSMPEVGTFNLHASLLPKYRGAAPINRAIMNGDSETGVTTFFLKHEIDTGDIIMQRKIAIGKDENVGSVHDRLMHIGAEMTVETISNIIDGTLKTMPQPEGEFTPAPKIFKEDCKIDWSMSGETIYNHIRGLSPYPAAWAYMREDDKEISVKIFGALCPNDIPLSEYENLPHGCVIAHKKRLLVRVRNGILEITEIQPAGKKRMSAQEFLLGYHPTMFH